MGVRLERRVGQPGNVVRGGVHPETPDAEKAWGLLGEEGGGCGEVGGRAREEKGKSAGSDDAMMRLCTKSG